MPARRRRRCVVTEITASFATPRPDLSDRSRPCQGGLPNAAGPKADHVEATDAESAQSQRRSARRLLSEATVRSEDRHAHSRGPRPFRRRCGGRYAARDSLFRVFGAPDPPGSCPADHRSGPAGHAAPEGAALLDPKASLTWHLPPVPLTPSRSPPEGGCADLVLRCPLAARRRPRFTGDHSRPKAKVTAFPVQHPSRSKVPLRAGGRGFAPRRSLSVGRVGRPTLLPLTEFDSSFRV